MKQVSLILISIFILSSIWISFWTAPRYPDLIEYLLITAPVGLMGFSFYPISKALFKLLSDRGQSDKRDE